MTKFESQFEYMEALKRALTMANVPYDKADATIAEYRQRFQDGLAGGRSEAEIAAELEDPRKVAQAARANAAMVVFQEKKTLSNFMRLFFAVIGLLVFNLFMIIPAILYSAMMFVLYAVSIAAYVVGIAVTSASLAGVNELMLDGPVRHVVMHRHADGEADTTTSERGRVSVQIDTNGVRVSPTETVEVHEKSAEPNRAGLTISGVQMDDDDRSKGVVAGIGLTLAGILLVLLSMIMTRFTWLGIKSYGRMHMNVLRNA